MKALVEEGLRRIISERKRRSAFRLRKGTFKGSGLQPHPAGASWEQIRGTADRDFGRFPGLNVRNPLVR